ncbi:hypothetical protein ZYGR_0AK05610 [Zygosaccharomyces rouxii]|uniref:Uncharacterized protein n=1 Tax=Zygosaccharomyces rouxii TaxID=4956 RepID=A0A1Q3AE67_ZYGRO|nr:hypothetical protein ZYGR_0AK05610 [Zygosaccharomyces rouxii]
MSLEEFLGDDSLGDSVWNEDDINLDAITNTTNIDILKTKTQKQQVGGSGESRSNSFGYRSPPPHHNVVEGPGYAGDKINAVPMGPPYIVKFSQLPPNFASVDIDDLFHEKFTKFNKCKMFWELNPNPSIATLNSGTVFEQNFKRENKVAFVELITGRDMDKILKYWTQPLLKYYNIKVEPAQFGDFNEYNAKVKLLTDPRDDASKPYIPPKPRQTSKSHKSNPFGSAKPVDTQSKILEIEEKVGKLHVEDTSTLRRISGSEPSNPQQQHQQHQHKVTLLKKPHEEVSASSSSAIEEPPAKPLSYLQVIKKTAEETKKSPSNSSATTRLSSPATNPATIATAPPATTTSTATTSTTNPISTADPSSSNSSTSMEKGSANTPSLDDGVVRYDNHNQYQQKQHHKNNYNYNNYHNDNHQHQPYQTDGEDRPYYKRASFPDNTNTFRGRGGGRGGSFRRGNGPRGGGFRYQNHSRRGGPSNYNSSSSGSFNNYNNQQQDGKNYPQDEKRYSIFKPASGFLWENGNDKTTNIHSQRGGNSNRGSYRGGRNRRNNGFTTV